MNKEAFIKDLRDLVDQIEALPEFVALPSVDIHFYYCSSLETLRAVRGLMVNPAPSSRDGTHWLECDKRVQISVVAFYPAGLLGKTVTKKLVERIVERNPDLSVLEPVSQ